MIGPRAHANYYPWHLRGRGQFQDAGGKVVLVALILQVRHIKIDQQLGVDLHIRDIESL
jgi:hypothetical protein